MSRLTPLDKALIWILVPLLILLLAPLAVVDAAGFVPPGWMVGGADDQDGDDEDEDDEYDEDEEVDIQPHGSSRYSVRALTPLPEFDDYFDTDFESEGIETIGGFLLRQIGHLPERGESVTVDRLTFKVLNADSRQVHLYQVIDNGGRTAEQP